MDAGGIRLPLYSKLRMKLFAHFNIHAMAFEMHAPLPERTKGN